MSWKEKRLEVGKPKDTVVVKMRGGEGLNKEMREKIKRLRAEMKNVRTHKGQTADWIQMTRESEPSKRALNLEGYLGRIIPFNCCYWGKEDIYAVTFDVLMFGRTFFACCMYR